MKQIQTTDKFWKNGEKLAGKEGIWIIEGREKKNLSLKIDSNKKKSLFCVKGKFLILTIRFWKRCE